MIYSMLESLFSEEWFTWFAYFLGRRRDWYLCCKTASLSLLMRATYTKTPKHQKEYHHFDCYQPNYHEIGAKFKANVIQNGEYCCITTSTQYDAPALCLHRCTAGRLSSRLSGLALLPVGP